ncbi:hypothetical protein BaRGS_00003084 [Batillaria attramentaria]|uniref:Uncharacterized protein n=1 Tax=Batillaria attramentaria TaxID=370345 RepID=A0ABD0M378_9CAEN
MSADQAAAAPALSCTKQIRPILTKQNSANGSSLRSVSTQTTLAARYAVNPRKLGVVSPLYLTAENHLGRTAIVDHNGKYTYNDLLHFSTVLSRDLMDICDASAPTLEFARVGFLCENDVSYVVTQWATWMAKGVAVPLCKSHPVSELKYFIQDSECSVLVASHSFADKLSPVAKELDISLRVLQTDELKTNYHVNEWFVSESATSEKKTGKAQKRRPKRWFDLHLFNNSFKNDPALIIYTSGTTGPPKGVVLTHGNLSAMVSNMTSAWAWTSGDVILHVLPLHHVHGVINALMTPLHMGATCLMLPKFDPHKVWSCLVNPASTTGGVRVNLFMAVPTIYAKLIEHYEKHLQRGRGSRLTCEYIKSVCLTRIRLMVSGSAALPQPVMERWESITGHRLLERYGMTEIGMALTNPLSGPRIAGSVGTPFPSVEVCISRPNVYTRNGYDSLAVGNSKRTTVMPGHEGEAGELLVRGPSVFHQYWGRPEATREAFTPDGWFKTGDTVMFENGVYKILGRTSVDVIKSGGYKISALDVERHLLAHPAIVDCAVVGLPDITWGQRVAAVIVLKDGHDLDLDSLRSWARDVLPPYQTPTVLRCLPSMPRNAMGKVNKKELVSDVFPEFFKQR